MQPQSGAVPPSLRRWSEAAGQDEQRTVIVRVRQDVDADAAAERLQHHGMQIQSAGADAVVAVTTPAALGRVGKDPWVTVIEEPARLFPRSS